jgi:hypothetical protein
MAVARPEAEKALNAAYAEHRKQAAALGAETPDHKDPWIRPGE